MTLTIQQLESKKRNSKAVYGTYSDVARLTIWTNKYRRWQAVKDGNLEMLKVIVGVGKNGKPIHQIKYRLDNINNCFKK